MGTDTPQIARKIRIFKNAIADAADSLSDRKGKEEK